MNWIKEIEDWHKKDKPLDATDLLPLLPEVKSFIINLIESGSRNHFSKVAYNTLRESSGKNRSPDLDKLITRNGGELGWPYCVLGIQDIFRNIEKEFELVVDLPKTAGVVKFWERSDDSLKSKHPKEFSIGCYRKKGTTQGHAVLCLGVPYQNYISTFEFNTSDNSDDSMVRDGGGAHYKNRRINGFGDMELLGFVDVIGALKR